MNTHGTSSQKTIRRRRRPVTRRALATARKWIRARVGTCWSGIVLAAHWSRGIFAVMVRTFDPLLCFVCICVGVLLTLPLPALLWGGFIPVLKQIGSIPLTSFPVAEVPLPVNVQTALLSVIPLALAVFRRHFYDWRDSSAPLAAKLLFAMYAGVCWPRAWWPQQPQPKSEPKP
jgi:hypothetical protein